MLVYPKTSNISEPNAYMPDDVRQLYQEADSVFHDSPRSSAALLRLALQTLTTTVLGDKAKRTPKDNIDAIAKEEFASPTLIKALDIIRYNGNESVHPGEINLNENPNEVRYLFFLLNMICEVFFEQPARLEEFYAKIPEQNDRLCHLAVHAEKGFRSRSHNMDVASNNEMNAGLVNIGELNPSVSISIHKDGQPKPSIFERISHAVDPVGYEHKRGQAALAALEYEIAMTQRVREEFPFMSPERARLYAHGFNRTEAQAANFEAVVEKVESQLDEPPKKLPEPAVEDAFADAMCDAYDEKVQDMLARALAGELQHNGVVSRNTLSIAKRMERDDILIFEYFCSLCSGGKDLGTGLELPTLPCIVQETNAEGSTYRELPYEAAMHLDSLGLVSMMSCIRIEEGEASFCIDGKGYHSERTTSGSGPLTISNIALTNAGEELSLFFDRGTHPKLKEIVEQRLLTQGFKLVPYLNLVIVENLTTGEGVGERLGKGNRE